MRSLRQLRNDQDSAVKRSWSTYWTESIQTDGFVKSQLLLLTFSTGIQDAVSFPDFRCFASNQTGNTVLFAVAVTGANSGLFDVVNTSLSLITFIAGCFLAGQLGNLIGRRKRYWQCTSQVIQTWLIICAAWIQLIHAPVEHDYGGYVTLMLLALGSGIQVGTARAMDVPEITTAMATAAWVDLMIDAQIFAMKNLSRNRRILFLLSLVAGSFAGAFLRREYGSAIAIFVSGGVKVVVVGAILLARAVPSSERLGGSHDIEGRSAMQEKDLKSQQSHGILNHRYDDEKTCSEEGCPTASTPHGH